MSTKTVNVHEAKTHLSALLEEVQAGKEIILANRGTPVAKLVPLETRPPVRKLGCMKGETWISDDFDKEDPQIIALFEGKYDEERKKR